MLKEHREQRIAYLLSGLQTKLLDIAFLKERVDHTTHAAKIYYQSELKKEEQKLKDIKTELCRLGATQ